jgi:hypothetical protein
MKYNPNNIQVTMSLIRDLVNSYPLVEELQKRERDWRKLCASMDTIEDTEEAIIYYKNLSDFSADGGAYLFLYGLFQVLYVQQNSVNDLYTALFDEPTSFQETEEYSELKEVREIRNDIFGHPTDRKDEEEGKRSHIISRMTISKVFFQTLDYHTIREDGYRSINVMDCIKKQNTKIFQILKGIHKKLKTQVSSS